MHPNKSLVVLTWPQGIHGFKSSPGDLLNGQSKLRTTELDVSQLENIVNLNHEGITSFKSGSIKIDLYKEPSASGSQWSPLIHNKWYLLSLGILVA